MDAGASPMAGHLCRGGVDSPGLTADEQSVMFTDYDGGNPRPWLLWENCVCDITHDIEGGGAVWAREVPRPQKPGGCVFVDAGDVAVGIHSRIVALHQPRQATLVDDDFALEPCMLPKFRQSVGSFVSGWPDQCRVLVGVDHGEEVLASGQYLFGLNLGAETGLGSAKWPSNIWAAWWR